MLSIYYYNWILLQAIQNNPKSDWGQWVYRPTAYFAIPAWLDIKHVRVQFFIKKQKHEKHVTIISIIFSYIQFLFF